MKRFLAIFLAVFLIFSFNTNSFAARDIIGEMGKIDLETYEQYLENFGDILNGYEPGDPDKEEHGDSASGIIKTILDVIEWILSLPMKIFMNVLTAILPSMESVVFNQGFWGTIFRLGFFSANPDDYSLGHSFQTMVSSLYIAFRYIAIIFL